MLSYQQGTSRLDISMATHQSARVYIAPKLSHEQAGHCIGIYLKATQDTGIIFRPDINKGLECFLDADI